MAGNGVPHDPNPSHDPHVGDGVKNPENYSSEGKAALSSVKVDADEVKEAAKEKLKPKRPTQTIVLGVRG